MSIDLIDLQVVFRMLGICGFILYMTAFFLLQVKVIDGSSVSYSAMNVAAASLVLISLQADFNLSSFLIQISWISIGLYGIALRLGSTRKEQRQ